MAYSGAERRQFPRANVACRLVISASNISMDVRTENIGPGGIRVLLPHEIARDTLMCMELHAEEGKVVSCQGYIAWIMIAKDAAGNKIYDTGIKFSNLSDEDRRYMCELVERINNAHAAADTKEAAE